MSPGDIPEATEANRPPQQRKFFRIDAEVSIRCWLPDADPPAPTRPVEKVVNVSGCGLRFKLSEPLKVGQLIGLEIALPENSAPPIECAGKVVRVIDEGGDWQDVALDLVELDFGAQDRIVSFCLAEQRRQLRMKVRV